MGVCSLAGCGHGSGIPEPSAATSDAPARGASAEQADPDAQLSSAKRSAAGPSVRANELSAPGLDDRFAVARQVTALERSIELYQMFIERAGDDPRYEEAVRRSRARIDDARTTICFLLEKPCDDAGAR
jgi:hypothetical protein